MPRIVNAAGRDRDLAAFLCVERGDIGARLVECGAILFRGFDVFDVSRRLREKRRRPMGSGKNDRYHFLGGKNV